MPINKIGINNSITFRADKKSVNPQTGEYSDPLMKWPLRGAAFTNEVGEALRPLIGNYATLSWVPALLYIGADIYDKYKNDQTKYSPSSHRGLEQAIFQGMASIFLPLVAVKAGQNLFSLIGQSGSDKITYNTKEHITELAQEFVANGKMRAHKNNDQECVKEFLDIVANNMDYKKQRTDTSNIFKKTQLWLSDKLCTVSKVNKKENIDKYAESTINELIKMRKDLLNTPIGENKTQWHKHYKSAMDSGQTKNVAVKSVLNKYLQNKTLKGKTIKTIGGFIALGMAIKPIDHFVEEVLIGKVIAPKLAKKKSA